MSSKWRQSMRAKCSGYAGFLSPYSRIVVRACPCFSMKSVHANRMNGARLQGASRYAFQPCHARFKSPCALQAGSGRSSGGGRSHPIMGPPDPSPSRLVSSSDVLTIRIRIKMPRLFRRSAIGLLGNKYGHPGVLHGVDRLSTGVAGRFTFQRNIGAPTRTHKPVRD